MYKILLVEDDPLMSRMYERVFKFEGLDLQLAGNGLLGLEKLKDFHPDLMLVDVMMPRMNGVEMLNQLKADPATKDIPVIMLTNLSDLKTAEDCVAKGALRFFIKSKYDPDQVAIMIKELLNERSKAK